MKHEKIDSKARVWVVKLGPDGKLQGEVDAQLLTTLDSDLSPDQIADALVIAAGTAEIAETRLW